MWQIIIPIAAGIGGYLLLRPNPKIPPATPAGHPVEPVKTMPMVVNPVTGKPVPAGSPTFVSQVQANGTAVQAAHDLFDYLKAHGYDNTPTLAGLVLDFQKKHNSDKMAVALGGPLIENGRYDTRTSPVLSMMIGDVIPADPNAPKPPRPSMGEILDVTKPGAAALAGFNLQIYYKKNTHDKNNPIEKVLVRQFQSDVNTDPKFPGPAYGISGLPKLITAPLSVDGNFGPASLKALNVLGGLKGQD